MLNRSKDNNFLTKICSVKLIKINSFLKLYNIYNIYVSLVDRFKL